MVPSFLIYLLFSYWRADTKISVIKSRISRHDLNHIETRYCTKIVTVRLVLRPTNNVRLNKNLQPSSLFQSLNVIRVICFVFLSAKEKKKENHKVRDSISARRHSAGAEESDWRKIQNANCTFTDVLQCVKNGVGT